MRAGRIMSVDEYSGENMFYLKVTIETSFDKYQEIRIDFENKDDFRLGVGYWNAIFRASEALHEMGHLFTPAELEDQEEKIKDFNPGSKSSGSNPFFNFGLKA